MPAVTEGGLYHVAEETQAGVSGLHVFPSPTPTPHMQLMATISCARNQGNSMAVKCESNKILSHR